MARYKLVKYDTWQAFYDEDMCLAQDHEVSYEDINDYYGDTDDMDIYYVTEDFDEYLSSHGRFPEEFSKCLEIDPNMRKK